MEDSDNIDVTIRLDQISDSIVAVEKNSDGTRGFGFVSIASFRMVDE
jgi:hypothetical protein